MRRPQLHRRPRQNRLSRAYEGLVVRVLAVVWVARRLVRHALSSR